MQVTLLFVMVIGFLLIGMPIAVSLGLASLIFLLLFSNDSLASIALSLFHAMEHYTLLAIPFFIVASSFMSTGGVARRIIDFAIASVGHIRGGLAIAGVFACMMFAALSGSSPATVVAVGSISIAGMIKAGYPKEFAAGVICNAGTLGILIPPSIVMVVYAAATDVSVGRMFLAGIIPGIVAGLMLMVGIFLVAGRKGLGALPWAGWGEIRRTFRAAFWGLFLIVVVFLGIYGLPGFVARPLGITGNAAFTPTEAAAVAAVYSYLVALFLYRDMGPMKGIPLRKPGEGSLMAWGRNLVQVALYFVPALFHRDTRKTLADSARMTIMLMFIIANALILKQVLTTEEIPQQIARSMLDAGFNWFTFLIMVNIILLIGGQFMEPSGLIIIVAPLVFPIAMQLGIDPIHLGIIMVVNMEIGMITPPVGLNLFVTSGVAQMPVMSVVRAALPWLSILFLLLIIVTYVPILSTFLPNMILGPEIVTIHK